MSVTDVPGFVAGGLACGIKDSGAPDLAIEVVSPSDRYTEVEEKADDLLRGGTAAVIIVDPARSSVRIHRASETVDVAETIAVDDVVPGWRLPLSEIFEE